MSITSKAKGQYQVLDINGHIADIGGGLGMLKTGGNTDFRDLLCRSNHKGAEL